MNPSLDLEIEITEAVTVPTITVQAVEAAEISIHGMVDVPTVWVDVVIELDPSLS